MQSFLMPWNDSDDGYLAIFLRQLSRRGLLLFYCSQKLTELDTPISFPLSFVPPLLLCICYAKNATREDCIRENNYCTLLLLPNAISGKLTSVGSFSFFWAFFWTHTYQLLLSSYNNVYVVETGHSFLMAFLQGWCSQQASEVSTEKKTCIVPCFYYRHTGHAFIMYAK